MTQESYTPLHKYQIAVVELLQTNTLLQDAIPSANLVVRGGGYVRVKYYRNDFCGRWSSSYDLLLIETLLYFWKVSCFGRLFVLGADDDAESEVCRLREAEDWVEPSFGSAEENMLPMFVQGVSAMTAPMKPTGDEEDQGRD